MPQPGLNFYEFIEKTGFWKCGMFIAPCGAKAAEPDHRGPCEVSEL